MLSCLLLLVRSNSSGVCPCRHLPCLFLPFPDRCPWGWNRLSGALFPALWSWLVLPGPRFNTCSRDPSPPAQVGQVPSCVAFFIPLTSVSCFCLLLPSSTAVNMHLMEEFTLNKDTSPKTGWASPGTRASEAFSNCLLDGCM